MVELKFVRAGCKPFFKKHPQAKRVATAKISTAIDLEVATGMTKVKLALRQRGNGLPCYEMRLNLGKVGSVRMAFTVEHNQATVYFLTTDLQKSEFSREVTKVLG